MEMNDTTLLITATPGVLLKTVCVPVNCSNCSHRVFVMDLVGKNGKRG